MIIAVIERYGVIGDSKEVFFYRKEIKEIFEKLGVLLFPISSLTQIDNVINICDGLIITGGVIDINPKWYNEKPLNKYKNIIYGEDDEIDFAYIKKFYENNKPILGICRGIQSINVYFGGSLYQDIPKHNFKDKTETHSVKLYKNYFLYNCYNKEKIEVNSFHHQSIREIACDFKVTAISDDGIIEGIESENILGVQWHPEIMRDISFFKKFIENYL
jgi:putative glutamine amidotransferase